MYKRNKRESNNLHILDNRGNQGQQWRVAIDVIWRQIICANQFIFNLQHSIQRLDSSQLYQHSIAANNGDNQITYLALIFEMSSVGKSWRQSLLILVNTRNVQSTYQLQHGKRVRHGNVGDRSHCRNEEGTEIRSDGDQHNHIQTSDWSRSERTDTGSQKL